MRSHALAYGLLASSFALSGCGGLGGGRYYTSTQSDGELVVEVHDPGGAVIHTARAALAGGSGSQTVTGEGGVVEKVETTMDMRKAGKDKVKVERNYRRTRNGEPVIEIQTMTSPLSTAPGNPDPLSASKVERTVTRVKYKGETIPSKP